MSAQDAVQIGEWFDWTPRKAAESKGIIYTTIADTKERQSFRAAMELLNSRMMVPMLDASFRVDFVAPSRYWMRRVMYWRRKMARKRTP